MDKKMYWSDNQQFRFEHWLLMILDASIYIDIVCHFLQDNKETTPVSTATFERIFDVSIFSTTQDEASCNAHLI